MSAVITSSLGPVEAVGNCFRKAAQFHGRSRRSEFWWLFVFNSVVEGVFRFAVLFFLAMFIASSSTSDYEFNERFDGVWLNVFVPVWYVIRLGYLIPIEASAMCRRFHDAGFSGWFWLLGLVSWVLSAFAEIVITDQSAEYWYAVFPWLFSMVPYAVMLSFPSVPHTNSHGPDPRYAGNALAPPPPISPIGGTGPVASLVPPVGSANHARLVLRGVGGQIGCSTEMTFGSRVLRRVLGDDAKYFDGSHFVLRPQGRRDWQISQCAGVSNPLYINGDLLGSASRALVQGDKISLRDGVGSITMDFGRG